MIKHPIVDNSFQYSPPLVAFGVLAIYLPTQTLGSRGVLLFLFCHCPHRRWTSVYVKAQLQRKVESLLLPFSRTLLQPDHNHISLEDKRTLPLPKKPSGCYRKKGPLLFTLSLRAQTSLTLVKEMVPVHFFGRPEDLNLSHSLSYSRKYGFYVHHHPQHFFADWLCAAASDAPCSALLHLWIPDLVLSPGVL